MHALTCVKCAAPLREGPEEASVTCPYCGTINEPTMARPTALQSMLQAEETKREAVSEVKAEVKVELKEELEQAMARQMPPRPAPIPPSRSRRRGSACGCCLFPLIAAGLILFAFLQRNPGSRPIELASTMLHAVGMKAKPADLGKLQDHQWVGLELVLPLDWAALDPAPGSPGSKSWPFSGRRIPSSRASRCIAWDRREPWIWLRTPWPR